MIETERLILREWRVEDIACLHAMREDADVQRYLGPSPGLEEARATHDRMTALQAANGCCFWVIARKSDGAFLGYCGLKPGKPPIGDEIEIGWALVRDAWGQGIAREAAEASLAWGWANLDVPSVAAITTPGNERSWRLMERLGMIRYRQEDFDHPDLAPGDPLRPHVLYRIGRPA